jgi:hypothetical protein
MNREQIIAIFRVLKTAYPRFYADMTKKEAEDTINLWTEMFKHDNPVIVTAAVKNLITTFKFPPTIADVKEAIYKTTSDNKTASDYWNELDYAARNCLYREAEVFESLSEPVKKFLGNPAQLRELAMMDANTFSSVTKGQFLKQIEVIKQREKEDNLMLPETREILKTLTSKLMIGE